MAAECQTSIVTNGCLTRRGLLLAGAAAVGAAGLGVSLSGCEAASEVAGTTPNLPPEPLIPVLAGQQELLATYERTLLAFPELGAVLDDLRGQSQAHTQALLDAAPGAAAQLATTDAGSSTPGSETSSTLPPAAQVTPPDAATALAELARDVAIAAGTLKSAALRAEGALAALLTSCAASTSCHAWLLTA